MMRCTGYERLVATYQEESRAFTGESGPKPAGVPPAPSSDHPQREEQPKKYVNVFGGYGTEDMGNAFEGKSGHISSKLPTIQSILEYVQ